MLQYTKTHRYSYSSICVRCSVHAVGQSIALGAPSRSKPPPPPLLGTNQIACVNIHQRHATSGCSHSQPDMGSERKREWDSPTEERNFKLFILHQIGDCMQAFEKLWYTRFVLWCKSLIHAHRHFHQPLRSFRHSRISTFRTIVLNWLFSWIECELARRL